jgi:hypothetical protein
MQLIKVSMVNHWLTRLEHQLMQRPAAVYLWALPGGKIVKRWSYALAGIALLFLSSEPASACMPFTRWFHNQTVDGYMTVRSGKPCHLNFRSSGPTLRTDVVARPSNGTVTIGSVGRLTYRSRSGFVGKDAFTYARRGMSTSGGPMDAKVRVLVTVTQ